MIRILLSGPVHKGRCATTVPVVVDRPRWGRDTFMDGPLLKPARKRFLIVILLVQVIMCTSWAEQHRSRLYVKGDWQSNGDGRRLRQQFRFMSEGAQFTLSYDIETGNETRAGKCTSSQWIFKKGFVSLGMTSPTMANWYGQGFFRIRIDGMSLHDIPATFRVVRASGPDTMLQGTWNTPKGPVYVRFSLRGDDDKLLMQVALDPNTKAEGMEVELLAYPQGFKPVKLCVQTEERTMCKTGKIVLDPAKEPWAIYYDAGTPSGGPCGLVYVPREIRNITIDRKPYQINTILTARPGGRTITLGLWDFSRDRGDDSDKRSHVVKGGVRIANDVAAVARANWIEAPLPPAWNSAERIEMFRRRKQETPFDHITTDVVTPHIPWARPLVGGPIRTLVVAPRWTQRETVELAQRLDMDFDTVCLSGNMVHFPYWIYLYNGYDSYGYERKSEFGVLNDLETKLEEKRDCLILSWNFNSDMIPDDIQRAMVEKVRRGTGLLLFGETTKLVDKVFGKQAEATEWHPSRMPLSTLPVIGRMQRAKQAVWTAYTCGKGRIVAFHYPIDTSWLGRAGMTPALAIDDPDVLHYYDYFYSLLAEAVLWVAHRTLPIGIRFGPAPAEVRFDSDRRVRDAELEVLVDDILRANRRHSSLKIDIPLGQSTHAVPDIGMPNGPRYLNVRIMKDGKVLGWGTTYLAPATAGPAIKALILRHKLLQPGDTLAGKVQLMGPDEDVMVRVEVKDSAGRVLARRQMRPTGPGISFALTLHHPIMVLHYVTVQLVVGERVVDQRVEKVTVAQDRKIDDFHWLVWMATSNNATARHILPILARAGVDWTNNYGIQGSSRANSEIHLYNSSRYGLRSVPYITRIVAESCDGRIRKPCLTDPEYLETWLAGLRETARGIAPFSPLGYSLGDENYLCGATKPTDVCLSPTCLAAFARYLKMKYGSLATLNASWGTECKRFAEAVPATLHEVKSHPDLWPRWVDHRLFMDRVFARVHGLGRKAIREIDPDARVGWEGLLPVNGPGSWQRGYDFYQLCQAGDLVQVYAINKIHLEYLRSFNMPGSIVGAWYNMAGNGSEAAAKSLGWYLLFHGCNSSWYWMADCTGPALVFPDLRPTPQLQWLRESIGEIRSGIGKLLLNAKRADDGIALHYSQASLRCGGPLLGRGVDTSQWGFGRLVEDLGLQYDFVASEQIVSACLESYKVLILPASSALSPAEVRQITAFVKRGGVVIADSTPGILDDHGKVQDRGQLDDVFGIRSAGLPEWSEGRIELAGGGLRGGLALPSFDSTITLAGAKAWASAGEARIPCVTVNAFGKGYAVLLNMPIEWYDFFRLLDGNKPVDYGTSLRVSGKGQGVRRLMARLLELADVRPVCRITADGKAVEACETTRFTNGKLEVVCILKDAVGINAVPRTVTITLPRKAHVYDVRQKRYHGYTRAIDTVLTPREAIVLALLPYRVQSVTLAPITEKVEAGAVVRMRATIHVDAAELAGQHCFRMRVFSPDGQLVGHYGKNVLTGKTTAELTIPTALNDSPGRWRVDVVDVATGLAGQAGFTITHADTE